MREYIECNEVMMQEQKNNTASTESKITQQFTPRPYRRLQAQTGPHPVVEAERHQRH